MSIRSTQLSKNLLFTGPVAAEARDGREGLTELGGGDRRGDPPARGPRHDLERKVVTRAVGVRPALGLLPLVQGLDEKVDHAGR